MIYRGVGTDEGDAKAKEHEIIFTETSAKTDQNVQNLFRTLAMNLTSGDQSTTMNKGVAKLKPDDSRKFY